MSQFSVNQKSINFNNSYAKLSKEFYSAIKPRVPSQPQLIKLNSKLAEYLGISKEFLKSEDGIKFLSGSIIIKGSEPIATVYAGHQFGYFSPQLGDGRAVLLGEVLDKKNRRYDLQLKGSGRTPYSRGGDGNAAIGPILREYIVSESMHAIGVPTTRSLAALLTGDNVVRERVLPGAILLRVASSHIRVGTFEFFASQSRYDLVRSLADYSIKRHFPELQGRKDRYLSLLSTVLTRQADLLAKWMSIGFIHGVMNTDNMTISGETIDYGPCAFLDEYDPGKVFSSIDHQGRYKYSNQPKVAAWNLSRFAETLLPLISDKQEDAIKEAQSLIEDFDGIYISAYKEHMCRKIGINNTSLVGSRVFEHAESFLNILESQKADFTNGFRSLTHYLEGRNIPKNSKSPTLSPQLKSWISTWTSMLKQNNFDLKDIHRTMNHANPFIIPRNHQIEIAIKDTMDELNNRDVTFKSFKKLLAICGKPYEENYENIELALPPTESQKVFETFCGT